MLDLIRRLYKLDLAPICPDSQRSIQTVLDYLPKGLPHVVHSWLAGTEVDGWVLPHSWAFPKDAVEIRDIASGEVIRGVLPSGYSKSFFGMIDGQELRQHVFTHKANPQAIPYHCDWYYKPHLRDWGIAAPRTLLDSIKDGQSYQVSINTETKISDMLMLDYAVPGTRNETYVLQAYNCHYKQANDNLSGIAVCAEVMRRLAAGEKRRYTYRFLMGPELFSTICFLATREQGFIKGVIGPLLVGHRPGKHGIVWQRSFWERTPLDYALWRSIRPQYPNSDRKASPFIDDFRAHGGSDEIVWAVPPYEIPRINLIHPGYPFYHMVNLDTPDQLDEETLERSVQAIMGVIDALEESPHMRWNGSGLPCLGNPRFSLHVAPGTDPSVGNGHANAKMHKLMAGLPQYAAKGFSIADVLYLHYPHKYFHMRKSLVPVEQYIMEWAAKGLMSLV